jgi:hypothetical protein
MSALSSDTDPKMEALQVRLLRSAPAWCKLEMLTQLNSSKPLLALSGLRQRHPVATPERIQRMSVGLLLGEELARKVYGELETETVYN